MVRWARGLGLALALVVAGEARAEPGKVRLPALSYALPAGGVVDYAAGVVWAEAGAAADPRAKDIEVARLGAERTAAQRAREILREAVAGVPLASGGTVGRVASEAAVAARLAQVVARAKRVAVSYAADGGARVRLAVPLEAVRGALAVSEPPTGAASAPTGIIVDARGLSITPALGWTLGGGVALPTLWASNEAAAAGEARLGPRVLRTKASAGKRGVLGVGLAAEELEQAARAGALVVIVWSE